MISNNGIYIAYAENRFLEQMESSVIYENVLFIISECIRQ